MKPIDGDMLVEKLDGIWDCNDMTFEPVDHCCINADCKSCRWRETLEYVKRLVKNMPPVKSPDIVHCSECEHTARQDEHEIWCIGRGSPCQMVAPDGFCDKGKARVQE